MPPTEVSQHCDISLSHQTNDTAAKHLFRPRRWYRRRIGSIVFRLAGLTIMGIGGILLLALDRLLPVHHGIDIPLALIGAAGCIVIAAGTALTAMGNRFLERLPQR